MTYGVTDVSIEGNSLRTFATNIKTRWGWENTASVGGQPLSVAYTDGGIMQNGSLDSKVLGLDMLVWGKDRATGTIVTTAHEHLQENIEWIKGLIGSGEGLDIRFDRPNSDEHQAYEARVTTSIQFSPTSPGTPVVQVRVPFWVPEGTLRDITGGVSGESDATNTNLTGSGSVNITTGGNARTSPTITVHADTQTEDLVLTFPDGASLSFLDPIPVGEDLVLDCQNRVVTLDGAYADAGLASAGRRAYWGYLEHGSTNAISYASTAGQFDITVDWYDRWR